MTEYALSIGKRMFHQCGWLWIYGSLWIILFSALSEVVRSDESGELRTIELCCIDDKVIHSATFQSNTQHLVVNRNGIFAAYLKSRNTDYTAQNWRLVQSTDHGKRFFTIAEGVAATNPPILETDENANLYLCRTDWKNNKSSIDIFLSRDDYKTIRTLELPGVAGGKFTMVLDQKRQVICFMTLDGVLHRAKL